jgi:hypothetical protein
MGIHTLSSWMSSIVRSALNSRIALAGAFVLNAA